MSSLPRFIDIFFGLLLFIFMPPSRYITPARCRLPDMTFFFPPPHPFYYYYATPEDMPSRCPPEPPHKCLMPDIVAIFDLLFFRSRAAMR
jgi:hypothetical protein